MILDNFYQCDHRNFSFNFYKKKYKFITYMICIINPNFIFVWDK